MEDVKYDIKVWSNTKTKYDVSQKQDITKEWCNKSIWCRQKYRQSKM